MRYEQRQNWNIIHFAEQLVSPPIRCVRKYGRIYAWSLSRSKTLTTISDSLVLSQHTCKCNLIYARKKSTSLPTWIFMKLNGTMCKFLLDIYISIWLYLLVVANCGLGMSEINEIPNFILTGQQVRKKFFNAPKQRIIFIASIFKKLVITFLIWTSVWWTFSTSYGKHTKCGQNFIYIFD